MIKSGFNDSPRGIPWGQHYLMISQSFNDKLKSSFLFAATPPLLTVGSPVSTAAINILSHTLINELLKLMLKSNLKIS